MGVAREAVRFPAGPPTLEAVRAAVERRAGLPVGLTATGGDHGALAFACLPDLPVEVRRHVRTVPLGKTERPVDAPDMVEVTADLQQDPTLFFQTCQALLDLGGTADDPPDESDERLRPVDEATLVRRARKQQRQARVRFWLTAPFVALAVMVAVLFLLPLTVFGYLVRDLFTDAPRSPVRPPGRRG